MLKSKILTCLALKIYENATQQGVKMFSSVEAPTEWLLPINGCPRRTNHVDSQFLRGRNCAYVGERLFVLYPLVVVLFFF
jgi:hypothetical protein